eukprot:NODE_164_length_14719_cov_1.036252.p10 type:complete len:102 gc:universal NODE_164_length_14719_cov_1.036252:265-570(+)
MYLKMETSNISFSLLALIANESYKSTQYFYSLKAFDILYNVDSHPDHWNGKIGSICGVLKQHIQDQDNILYKQQLADAVETLKDTSSPDSLEILELINKYQ